MNNTTELTLEDYLKDSLKNPTLQRWLDEAEYSKHQLALFLQVPETDPPVLG